MEIRDRLSVLALVVALPLAACGAKTGLLIPDASLDSGMDAGTDAGTDSGMCIPEPFALERRGAQIMFVIDRSNSMEDTLDGREPEPGELRRWDLVAQILDDVLNDADRLLEIGAKFYPRWSPVDPTTPEEACTVAGDVDLEPRRGNADALLAMFESTSPQGGTPTAEGLEAVRDYFVRRPASAVPRYVILATDGGPNCNPDTGVHHTMCLCTGDPDMCAIDPTFGPYNCIDDTNTYAVIRALFEDIGIPVYVIGIDDPTRPDLADVLDDMATLGGRPREEPGERRFYSVREPGDLRGALTSITDSISRCVFAVTPPPPDTDQLVVRVGEVLVPRDRTRSEGWDFTSPDRRELTLFGGACERVAGTGDEVIAEIPCPPEEE